MIYFFSLGPTDLLHFKKIILDPLSCSGLYENHIHIGKFWSTASWM